MARGLSTSPVENPVHKRWSPKRGPCAVRVCAGSPGAAAIAAVALACTHQSGDHRASPHPTTHDVHAGPRPFALECRPSPGLVLLATLAFAVADTAAPPSAGGARGGREPRRLRGRDAGEVSRCAPRAHAAERRRNRDPRRGATAPPAGERRFSYGCVWQRSQRQHLRCGARSRRSARRSRREELLIPISPTSRRRPARALPPRREEAASARGPHQLRLDSRRLQPAEPWRVAMTGDGSVSARRA